MGKEKKVGKQALKSARNAKLPHRRKAPNQDAVDVRSVEGSVNTLHQQLQMPNLEDKLCGLQSLGNLLDSDQSEPSFKFVVEKNIIRTVAPLLLDDNALIRNAAAGTLRNISMLSVEACVHLIEQDVMTLLIAFFQKYNENWIPKHTKSGNIDEDGDAFLQSINMLWNLCECSEMPVKRIEDASLLPLLTRCLDRKVFGEDFAVAVLQCLLVVLEDNSKATPTVKNLCGDFIKETLSIKINSPVDALIKALTLALFLNIEPIHSLSEDTTNMVMDILSTNLSLDVRNAYHQISSTLPLMVDSPDPADHKQNKTNQLEIANLKTSTDALQTTIEVLTNICSFEDDDTMDVDEASDVDSDMDDDCANDCAGMEESLNGHLPVHLCKLIKDKDVLQNLWQKTVPLAENVTQILNESDEGRILLHRLSVLQSKALLCLNNLLEILPLSVLGDLSGIYNIWVELGKIVFKGNVDDDILESAATVLRAALGRLKKEASKLNQANGNSFSLFKDLSLDDLKIMLSSINDNKNPETRANLSRMIGDLGLLVSTNDNNPTVNEIAIANFLLDRAFKESEFWILAEVLDTLMDLFSEDESDRLAKQVGLVEKLAQIAPNFKNKRRQTKNVPSEHYAVINTVAANLPRFIKYKRRRVELLKN